MKRRIKTVVAVTTLALTASASISAEACDRGGRRASFSRGPIGLFHSPHNRYSKPAFAPPVYSQPVYPQPQVSFQQPVQVSPTSQISTFHPQNVAPPQQPANPSMALGHSVNGQPMTSRAPASMPGTSAAPQQGPATAPRTDANNRAPAALAQTRNTTPNTTPNVTQTPSSQASAEASALQLLASIMTTDQGGSANTTAAANTPQIPEFGPANSNADPVYVGTWRVTLPGDQSVELALNADGGFTWTATKNGNSSNFQGQYRFDNDRLTLVRSNDLQQMAGSWTVNGEGFTFKLDGATTGGLSFSRS